MLLNIILQPQKSYKSKQNPLTFPKPNPRLRCCSLTGNFDVAIRSSFNLYISMASKGGKKCLLRLFFGLPAKS